MIAKKMVKYVEGSSVIRAMFEEGKKMAQKYGAENVYDFSLGNPSTLPPKACLLYTSQSQKLYFPLRFLHLFVRREVQQSLLQ